jgi:hypothetical protein
MLLNGVIVVGFTLLITFVLATSLAVVDVLEVYEDGTLAIRLGGQAWGFKEALPWTPLVTEASSSP